MGTKTLAQKLTAAATTDDTANEQYMNALRNLVRDGKRLGDNCDEVAAKMLGHASLRTNEQQTRIADALTGLLALALGQRL